jgi:hypothetical protein
VSFPGGYFTITSQSGWTAFSSQDRVVALVGRTAGIAQHPHAERSDQAITHTEAQSPD